MGLMVSFLALWAPTRATPPVPTKSLVVVDSWDEGDVGQIAPMVRDQVVAHLQNTATLEVTDDIAPESLAQKEGFRVRGRMIQMGEIYRAAVHLVDGRTGQTLASTHVERPANGSTDVLDEISTAIATFTRKEVGNALEARRLTEADVPDQALLLIDLAKADWALADSLHHKNAEEEAIATFLKADSTLAQVGEMAPDWDMPWVLRAEMALDWLWAEWNAPAGGEGAARSRAARGSMLASEALKRNPGEAGNYELRAQLNHWQWLFSQPDPTGSSADLMQWVVDDARQAVGMDPYRADSWKLLGMTFLSAGEWNDAYWALGRAANADTYLRSNTEIVANLFNAAWESGNRESARGWCGHLEKSNPGEWVTALCRLYLLADSDEPDLGLVDSLQASLETRPQWATIWRDQFQALSAVVQAGGPHPEAARQILENVGRPPADSDLAVLHAWAYLKLGDEATARRLLDAYVASSPGSNSWVWKSHRFEGLAP